MKRAKALIALIVLIFGVVGCFAFWKNVIQPKNTRIAFYEIMTAAKYNRRNPGAADQISRWLNELKNLEKRHLKRCEHIQYHNKTASLQRLLKSKNDAPVIKLTTLQKVSRLYSGEILTLENLSRLGEAEFETVISEIRLFENELKSGGFTSTLNELATQPKNFSTDSKEIEEIYNRFILKGEQTLTSRFYPYSVPKGTAQVTKKAHRWSTYAQYNRKGNSMTAYFDDDHYDLNIAAFISIHEMYPGHHLSARAGVLEPLCAGDRPSSSSWLGEGWATYVEFIADEEGFFEEPEQKLAWLDYRLTRAMRIILDVKRMEGVKDHQALKRIWNQRMPERLTGRFDREFRRPSKSRHQHLSYIFGYNAIVEAKAKLIEELGSSFDEKKFHDAVLRLEHREFDVFYETVKIAMEISVENKTATHIQSED